MQFWFHSGDRADLLPLFRIADESESEIFGYHNMGEAIVAREGATIAGMALVEKNGDVIQNISLAVLPQNQLQGLGSRLVAEAASFGRINAASRLPSMSQPQFVTPSNLGSTAESTIRRQWSISQRRGARRLAAGSTCSRVGPVPRLSSGAVCTLRTLLSGRSPLTDEMGSSSGRTMRSNDGRQAVEYCAVSDIPAEALQAAYRAFEHETKQ